MWAPLAAQTPLGAVRIVTDYPFGDVAVVTVTPLATSTPVWLRIPSWATAATLSINGELAARAAACAEACQALTLAGLTLTLPSPLLLHSPSTGGAATPLTGSNGTFFPTATVGAAATTFTLSFNPVIRLEPAYNGAVAVLRGALLYSAWIGQVIGTTRSYAFNSKDLEITSTTPWNLALVVDSADPSASLTFQRLAPPSSVPYNSTDVPVVITGSARLVSSWVAAKNAPGAPPASPACASPGACSEAAPVVLVPFGSTHVRMAVLPTA